jgi:hypothetical protein
MDHQELNIFKPCSKIIKHAVISMMIYIPVYAMHMSKTMYHYIKREKRSLDDSYSPLKGHDQYSRNHQKSKKPK